MKDDEFQFGIPGIDNKRWYLRNLDDYDDILAYYLQQFNESVEEMRTNIRIGYIEVFQRNGYKTTAKSDRRDEDKRGKLLGVMPVDAVREKFR